jgi:hypothetical protein
LYRPNVFTTTSAKFNVYAPVYSVSQVESEITVEKDKNFITSFYIVDAASKMEAPNPGYKV